MGKQYTREGKGSNKQNIYMPLVLKSPVLGTADEPHLIVPTGIRLFSVFTTTYDADVHTRVTGISTYQLLKYRGQTYRNPAHPAPNSEGPFG